MDPKRLLYVIVGLVLAMLGLSFAAVPLYRMFCQTTGFGGTTQVAPSLSTRMTDRVFTVRFSGDVHRDVPWRFRPLQNEIKVHAGENALALYHVENLSNEPLVGMATYNVTPDRAGGFFQKVECFCFLEQRLEPHQSLDMPVLFYIDADAATDPVMDDVHTITLSYTFFLTKDQDEALTRTAPQGKAQTHSATG